MQLNKFFFIRFTMSRKKLGVKDFSYPLALGRLLRGRRAPASAPTYLILALAILIPFFGLFTGSGEKSEKRGFPIKIMYMVFI